MSSSFDDGTTGGVPYAVAAGRSGAVTVEAGTNTPVAVGVRPWTASISGPAEVQSGASVTYTITIGQSAIDGIFVRAFLLASLNAADLRVNGPDAAVKHALLHESEPTTVTATFNAPAVTADTAMFIRVYLDGINVNFGSEYASRFLLLPSQSLGEAPFRVPVKVPAGGITVSFERSLSGAVPE